MSFSGKKYRGFTLIELLVVIAIMAIVLVTVGASLSAGIKAWDAARSFNAVESEATIGLESFDKDAGNTFLFYGIPFHCEPSAVSFPKFISPVTLSGEVSLGEEEKAARIGTVRYYFDPALKALMRKQWIFPAPEPEPERAEKVVAGLEGMNITFRGTAGASAGADSTAGWNSVSNHPYMVRMELFFGKDEKLVKCGRTVVLPAVALKE